jgi:hypothetical protein
VAVGVGVAPNGVGEGEGVGVGVGNWAAAAGEAGKVGAKDQGAAIAVTRATKESKAMRIYNPRLKRALLSL